MMVKRVLKVNLKEGLHTRVIAAIARESVSIEKKCNVKLYIEYKNRGITPIGAVMSFIFFKVKYGEEVILYAKGDGNGEKALDYLEQFFNDDINEFLEEQTENIDNLITDKAITVGEIINSIDNGVIVEEDNGEITLINSSASKLLELNESEILGRNIKDILCDIKEVTSHNKGQVARGKKGDRTFLIYKNPLKIDGQTKGSIYVLEDISILEEMIDELSIVKELKEKLQLILDTVGDGVCVINSNGLISYVNDNYKRMVEVDDLLGKSIYEISPKGIRRKVLEEGEAIIGEIIEKSHGHKKICSVYPLKVDGVQTGVVSFVKEIDDVKQLSHKLDKASERVKYLEEELLRTKKPHEAFNKYIGRSGKVIDSLALATKAAKSNAIVLIRGESGTGKELIAEGIHYASERNNGPFIRVNCAAIPESLIESELFGYEKGAFTGAVKRKLGKFELAHHGTIFLDEIGEMDKNTQSKILRVLQYKEFQRVGGETTVKVDVRIIAATHRNLEEMVKKSEFREDLYYRLNVIPIMLPPLRERKEDIPLIADHFINKLKGIKKIRGISIDAMEKLCNYNWKGNVRELENIIERIIALCEDDVIGVKDLPTHIVDSNKIVSYEGNEKIENDRVIVNDKHVSDEIIEKINVGPTLTMKEYEKIIIEKALKEYGSYNKAAKALGLTHRTVGLKAKQYGLEKVITWQ